MNLLGANKITGANAGGPSQFPIRTFQATRIAQFWRQATTRAMKWAIVILVSLAAAFVAFSVAHGRSLRRASLINGANQLRVAQDDYLKHGYFTNYPTSGYHVMLSTNVVTIGGKQYQCFAEVAGGWGWEGGTLAMTTNQTLIWLDARKPPMIITLSHRPPIFGGPY